MLRVTGFPPLPLLVFQYKGAVLSTLLCTAYSTLVRHCNLVVLRHVILFAQHATSHNLLTSRLCQVTCAYTRRQTSLHARHCDQISHRLHIIRGLLSAAQNMPNSWKFQVSKSPALKTQLRVKRE